MQNLCSRYNLSERALRRRVAALGTVITPHIGHGQNNTFLIADGGLAILDRLAQIQRETGLGLSGAVERVRSELANGSAAPSEPRPNGAEHPGVGLEDLRSMITYLKEENRWLKDRLEEKDQQIKALMPGPRPDIGNNNSLHLTRWQAFRILLLGR